MYLKLELCSTKSRRQLRGNVCSGALCGPVTTAVQRYQQECCGPLEGPWNPEQHATHHTERLKPADASTGHACSGWCFMYTNVLNPHSQRCGLARETEMVHGAPLHRMTSRSCVFTSETGKPRRNGARPHGSAGGFPFPKHQPAKGLQTKCPALSHGRALRGGLESTEERRPGRHELRLRCSLCRLFIFQLGVLRNKSCLVSGLRATVAIR